MSERAEVVVVGMGPGGEDVAGRLAEEGLDVVGIDANLVGGECPYWGCIPSKMIVRASDLLAEARRVTGNAGTSSVSPDYAPVAQRIREQATDSWDDTVAVERFEGKGGRFVRGRATLAGQNGVVVDGTAIEATRALVIATGTDPAVPPIPGLEDVDYWTNREAMEAKELPASIVVLGAGAVGAELGQAYARFGAEVTIVEALDRVLPLEDPVAGEVLGGVLSAEGIEVRTGVRAESVGRDDELSVVELSDGTALRAERVLVATGRHTDLAGLGTATCGIDEDQRFIPVDGTMRAAEGVWAVGDITGKGLFTHLAIYQAGIAAEDILGNDPAPADYRALPRVTFTDPEVGAVGLSEAEAGEQGLEVAVSTAQVPSTARGWLHGPGNEGVIKLVADRARGVLVGATSVGPHGGEVLGLLTVAVHAEVPIADLRRMIYAYPTFHKGVEDALRDLP